MTTTRIILIVAACFILVANTGCKKANNFCGAINPTTDIAWVKQVIDSHGSDSIKIYKLTYHSIDGFFVSSPASGYFNDCNNTSICFYNNGGIAGGWNCIDRGNFDKLTTYKFLIYSSY